MTVGFAVFVANSEDAKAVGDYIKEHSATVCVMHFNRYCFRFSQLNSINFAHFKNLDLQVPAAVVVLCKEVFISLRCEGGLDMKDSSVADRLRKQVCKGTNIFFNFCEMMTMKRNDAGENTRGQACSRFNSTGSRAFPPHIAGAQGPSGAFVNSRAAAADIHGWQRGRILDRHVGEKVCCLFGQEQIHSISSLGASITSQCSGVSTRELLRTGGPRRFARHYTQIG